MLWSAVVILAVCLIYLRFFQLTRGQIVNALMPADTEALQEENIKNGFLRCGLYPLDPTANPTAHSSPPPPEVEPEPEEEYPPLSPQSQELISEVLEIYARGGVSEKRAKKLLRNMNVPGNFSCLLNLSMNF